MKLVRSNLELLADLVDSLVW